MTAYMVEEMPPKRKKAHSDIASSRTMIYTKMMFCLDLLKSEIFIR